MKILILSDDYPPNVIGGAGVVAYSHVKQLVVKGYEVVVVTTVQNRNDEGSAFFEGVYVYRIYTKYHERWRAYVSLYNFQTVRKVKKIIQNFKPDFVHSHNIHSYLSYECLSIAKQSGAKVFLSIHDVMLFHYGKFWEFLSKTNFKCEKKYNYKISQWRLFRSYKKRFNPFRNVIIRYYLRFVDKIFPVSNALKDCLEQNGIKNMEAVHNGINITEWNISHDSLTDFIGRYKLKGKKIILFGGRLSNAKGGEQIIKALVEVVKKVPTATLLVMGEIDEYADKMLQIAKENGVGGSIVFTGWLSGANRFAAYNCSNLVVFPSIYFDPFGLVNIEAMACSKPVVATCFGGASEIVVHNKTGFVVNPYNVTNFSNAIVTILRDTKLALRFGVNGYERVKTHFTLDVQIKKFLLYYK